MWALGVLLLALSCGSCARIEKIRDYSEWNRHKEKYGLSFEPKEDARRMDIFHLNLALINQRNSAGGSVTLAMNDLGHLESHEIGGCLRPSQSTRLAASETEAAPVGPPTVRVPDHVDWRTAGVVNPVRSQGHCGSCYAFAAISALESAYAIDNGVLPKLSEQDVVDCTIGPNYGCRGGTIDSVFDFASAKGVATLDSYPYIAQVTQCRHNTTKRLYGFNGYRVVNRGDETALKRAIAFKGPVSVGIDASSFDFRFYKSGVYHTDSCSNDTDRANHAVTAVGYGTDGHQDYYIVRNSWGPYWGMEGYIKFARNADNMCGIANEAMYPM